MNVIPWKKSGNGLGLRDEFTNFLSRAFDDDLEWKNRLPAMFSQRNLPALNISESEDDYTVAIELPGMEEKDVNVELMDNQLLISGERRWEEEKKEKEFHRVESQYGTFERAVTLPRNLRLDAESIVAKFDKGILEIKMPKLEPTPTKKIKIKSK